MYVKAIIQLIILIWDMCHVYMAFGVVLYTGKWDQISLDITDNNRVYVICISNNLLDIPLFI